MGAVFPSAEWLQDLDRKLNNDAHYNQVARNWEGDMLFDIHPEGSLKESLSMYFDLWHGKCRKVEYAPGLTKYLSPKFILRAPYNNFTAILKGKLDPMTAMLTSKLKVEGSLGYMMRNVPTVLDFVRCCREITTDIL